MQSLKNILETEFISSCVPARHPAAFFIQLLLHTVKKISTAVIFSAFDVRIEAVAIFGVYAEKEYRTGASSFNGISPSLMQPISLMP